MLDSIHPSWQPLFDEQAGVLDEILSALPKEGMYPNPLHATGLAFAVPEGTKPLPPSLRNILLELESDLGIVRDGFIESWSLQGVMLLNRQLSTLENQTAAHVLLGWDLFTTAACRYLVRANKGRLVAILWGAKAQELVPELGAAKVISSPHPSPLSSYRGFFGSKPFSGCNKALLELGCEPIDWSR
ncbi:MAG: uracil-DNA glycosylase [Actinobacteria bacterium]|nr:uracil-DNA glycosylase [Actinomycetota bacterium]